MHSLFVVSSRPASMIQIFLLFCFFLSVFFFLLLLFSFCWFLCVSFCLLSFLLSLSLFFFFYPVIPADLGPVEMGWALRWKLLAAAAIRFSNAPTSCYVSVVVIFLFSSFLSYFFSFDLYTGNWPDIFAHIVNRSMHKKKKKGKKREANMQTNTPCIFSSFSDYYFYCLPPPPPPVHLTSSPSSSCFCRCYSCCRISGQWDCWVSSWPAPSAPACTRAAWRA